jgi:drug/metabolite transporter (DMT)-like permease
MTEDERTRDSEEVDAEAQRRFADLFDLRRIIGGLFVVYGLVLFVLGIGASDEDIDQAAGVNVNLWMGIALLLVGAIFIAWALARPVGAELVADQQQDDSD